MKAGTQKRISSIEDEFWTEHVQLMTAQFPSYYTKPQKVWGRFHTSEERYFATQHEIIPLNEKSGTRTSVMMQPYVLEPKLTIAVGLYPKPKRYADQDDAIGQTIGQPEQVGFQEAQAGNAQAWYYHHDKTIVLWECFFDSRFGVSADRLYGFERFNLQNEGNRLVICDMGTISRALQTCSL